MDTNGGREPMRDQTRLLFLALHSCPFVFIRGFSTGPSSCPSCLLCAFVVRRQFLAILAWLPDRITVRTAFLSFWRNLPADGEFDPIKEDSDASNTKRC